MRCCSSWRCARRKERGRDMPGAFEVVRQPPAELLETIAAEAPENPFWTPAYWDARRRLGGEIVVLTHAQDADAAVRCPAVIRAGRLSRSLEIVSLPALAPGHPFWR